MEKHDARFFVRHVLMNRHDVDLVFKQGSQDELQLIFCHCEVTINNGVVVAPGERCPRVYAHVFADLYAVHCCRSAERELDHSVLRFSLRSKDFVQGRAVIELFSGNGAAPIESLGFGLAARICFTAS